MAAIRKAASDYTREIFHKLREREYNPELMRLYVVVGGGCCMIQNFGEYDKHRFSIKILLTHRKLHGILFLMKNGNYLKANLLKGRDAKPEGAKVRKSDHVSRLLLFPYIEKT